MSEKRIRVVGKRRAEPDLEMIARALLDVATSLHDAETVRPAGRSKSQCTGTAEPSNRESAA